MYGSGTAAGGGCVDVSRAGTLGMASSVFAVAICARSFFSVIAEEPKEGVCQNDSPNVLGRPMEFPLRLALRYLGSKKRASVSVGTAFATLGVMLGVAALSIVMSVT